MNIGWVNCPKYFLWALIINQFISQQKVYVISYQLPDCLCLRRCQKSSVIAVTHILSHFFLYYVSISCYALFLSPEEMISIFQLCTFHCYVTTFQQHLHGEYKALSWYDVPELVVHIMISLLLPRKLLNQRVLIVLQSSQLLG
jgi:hypothetical protein